LDGNTRESVLHDYAGNKITTGNINNVKRVAVGNQAQSLSAENVDGSIIQTTGDVTLGNKQRDEQYDVVLNWEARGNPRMREYDLSNRNLSNLNLSGADLQYANLSNSTLNDVDLVD